MPWISHHLDLRNKEAVTPEYFGIHPQGLVPTLVHDGVVHIESNDIIEYLDATFPEPPLQPETPEARDKMRAWLRTATEIHLPAVKTVIYTRKIGKVLRKNPEEDAKYRALQRDPELLAFHAAATSGNGLPQENIDKAEATLFRLFDKVEAELSEHEWLVGEKFSLADISWVPLHFTLIGVAFPFEERYPRVTAWADKNPRTSEFPGRHFALVRKILVERASLLCRRRMHASSRRRSMWTQPPLAISVTA